MIISNEAKNCNRKGEKKLKDDHIFILRMGNGSVKDIKTMPIRSTFPKIRTGQKYSECVISSVSNRF